MEQNKWEFKQHSYQIGDTGDYDGWNEITNGVISLGTKDDDEETVEVLQGLINSLNAWDIDLYDPKADDLTEENAALQAKVDRYEKALREIAKSSLAAGQPSFMWQANEALAGEKEAAIEKICHTIADEVAKDADTAEAYLRKEGVDVEKVKEDAKFIAWLAELAALLHGAAQGQPIKINQAEARKWYDDGMTAYQCFRETWNME
jgi:hypothetical protein